MIGKKLGADDAGLYFHIPFCTRKCPYCHFYVLPDSSTLKEQLLKSLALEWEQRSDLLQDRPIASIYFGGGTPALFGPAIKEVLSWIPQKMRKQNCEITLEANPENVTLELMQQMKETGVNRVSIGVQSLDDATLSNLKRTHNAKKAIEAIENTALSGIENISIDLMYDLPDQTLESWRHTLSLLPSLPLTHLSLYNLIFEEPSLFFKKQKSLTPRLPTPELSLELLEEALIHLEKIGLKRYEISAFAKEGYHSNHNTGYWLARPFLGFGPSAFSYWDKKRSRNIANLKSYGTSLSNKQSPIDFEEALEYPANLHELLAVQLRLLEGVDLEVFQKRHGALPQETFIKLDKLHNEGYLQIDGLHVKLSERGLLFYDTVGAEIID